MAQRSASWLTPLYTSSEPYERLAGILRDRRYAQGASLYAMAQRCQVSDGLLGALERGEPGRRYRNVLVRIDKGFGWPPGTCVAILEGADPPPPTTSLPPPSQFPDRISIDRLDRLLPSSAGTSLSDDQPLRIILPDTYDTIIQRLEHIEAKTNSLFFRVWQAGAALSYLQAYGITARPQPAQPYHTAALPAAAGSITERLTRIEAKIDRLTILVTLLVQQTGAGAIPASLAGRSPTNTTPVTPALTITHAHQYDSTSQLRTAEQSAAQHEQNLQIKQWARTQGMTPNVTGPAPRWMRQAWEQAQSDSHPTELDRQVP